MNAFIKKTRDYIESRIDCIWMKEPDDLKLVRWGVILSGAGVGKQSFTCMVNIQAFTMQLGPRVLYPLLNLARRGDFDIGQLKLITTILLKNHNPFGILGDMGMREMKQIGSMYYTALDQVETLDEYIALTTSLMTYCNRMFRWVYWAFPWNIGIGAFPQRNIEEMQEVVSIVSAMD